MYAITTGNNKPEDTFARAGYKKMGSVGYEEVGRKGSYVCRGSTKKETSSTVRKCDFEKTRTLFPCDEPCGKYYDLLRDPEKRATFGIAVVTGSL